jgi:hypothetical protein
VLTLFIALLINRATYRDAQALIQALLEARNAIASIDKAEPEDFEAPPRRTAEQTLNHHTSRKSVVQGRR